MSNPVDAKALFQDAQELPCAERSTFLDRACGGDAALRARIEALLAADDRAGSFLGSPTRNVVDDAAPREQPGESIGHFKLQQQIGEGGFGIVWMAEQQEPVRRQVALKIVKPGMDTRSVVARFEQERQALAMMDHQNIAKVFDGGETPAGLPYFVMELVRGAPITQFCDQQHLDSRERLSLFVQVCHAVQHAHQKGIIHRDIKPSNVLVTLHEGSPVPKVIDFGIAKALHRPLTEKTLFTEFQQMIGTPEYMSPEQAELSGLDIDTRADVYGLGVLLYELLTGTLPFDVRTLIQKGMVEVLRTIREDEPPKPSTRVSTPGLDGDAAAKARRTDPQRLGRLLRGDLDWIVMKALEKDRNRRYVSADAFAADVERYLCDEPVEASPPSRAYRLRKYVRRHRVGVVAAILVVGALTAGLAATTWGFLEASSGRNLAVKATNKSEQIARFMGETLKGAGPSVARGRDSTMLREMMDAAATRIENGELKGAPEAELWLRITIGGTYVELGMFDRATFLLDPVVAQARALHAGDHEDKANAMAAFACLLTARGDLEAAEPLLRQSLLMHERLHSGNYLDVMTALNNLSVVLSDRGSPAEAEQLQRDFLEMQERLIQGDDPTIAFGLNNRAGLLQKRGALADAEPLFRRALDMRRRLFPDGHPDVVTSLGNLAQLLLDRGDQQAAEPYVVETLTMAKEIFPPDHPLVADAMDRLAILLRARGDLAGAELQLRGALQVRRQLFPDGNKDVAISLINLGVLLGDRDQSAEAEQLFHEALTLTRRLYPEGHTLVAICLSNRANQLESRGDLEQAEERFNEAVNILNRCGHAESAEMATCLLGIAGIRYQRGDSSGSEEQYRRALAMRERFMPGDHEAVATAQNNLALMLKKRGDLAGAEPLYRQSLEMRRRLYRGEHKYVLSSLNNLVVLLHARGDLDGAVTNAREALDMSRRVHPDAPARVLTAIGALAFVLKERGDLVEAELRYGEALEMTRDLRGDDHPEVASALAQLGVTQLEQHKYVEAAATLLECLRIREAKRPADWTTFNTMSLLGGALAGLGRHEEADSLLRRGYEELEPLQSGATRKREALDRLIQHYIAWGKPEEAARWRKVFDDLPKEGGK